MNDAIDDTIKQMTSPPVDPEVKLQKSIDFGAIAFESDRGVIQSNCMAKLFWPTYGEGGVLVKGADEALNEYCKNNIGLIAVQMMAMSDGLLMCIFNRVLDQDEQDILRDKQEVIQQLLAEKKKLREEAHQAEMDANDKRLKELEDLQEQGLKCRHNHAAVIDENQLLKKEVRDLKKRLTKKGG